MDKLVDENRDIEAFVIAFKAFENICKLFKIGGLLPAISGDPAAEREVEAVIDHVIPVEMGFTEEGWFAMRIPRLLPRKEKGNNDHLRQILNPAFRRYFHGRQDLKLFDSCCIIFRHVYDKEFTESARYDLDNFEQNFVTDLVAMYAMVDDSAKVCDHYLCSAPGSEARTEVYVVPREDFRLWLDSEPMIPDEGVKIVGSEALI